VVWVDLRLTTKAVQIQPPARAKVHACQK